MSHAPSTRAVVLLSGGLDSTTLLAWARNEGREVDALSFSYGQRHSQELQCAARQAQRWGAKSHRVVELSHMAQWVAAKSSLVSGSSLEVPLDKTPGRDEIPNTYVPARNTLFLSYALALAECVDASEIWIGVNALDYSGYPDCRPEFIEAFAKLANLATCSGVQGEGIAIRAPLTLLGKAEIVAKATELGVDLQDTVSCYHPSIGPNGETLACGRCDSCELRRAGFAAAKIPDPTRYATTS